MLKRKRRPRLLIITLLISLFLVGSVYGNDIMIRYKFRSIEKVQENINEIFSEGNNADYYIGKPVSIVEDDWLTDFAGGREEEIRVNIGKLVYDYNEANTEAYIDLKGKNTEITLIANGAQYEYYEGTDKIKRKVIDFLTGKKLEGQEVVKDYSEGKEKIILVIDFNEDGTSIPRVLFCLKNNNVDHPKNNYYNLEFQQRDGY